METMKFFLKKEICLWLVPSRSGRVRKLRLSFGHLAGLLGSIAIVCFIFTYVLGDYSRVQLSRYFTQLRLGRVATQRDNLRNENSNLKSELTEVQKKNQKVLSYKESVEQRLAELKAILKSVSPVDPFEEEGKSAGSESDLGEQDAMGGAEIECYSFLGLPCGEKDLGTINAFKLTRQPNENGLSPDLIQELDDLVLALKSLPIGVPGNGWISSDYGLRRSPFTGRLTKHEGIDFRMSLGSEVHSTADGVVEQVKRDGTYGLRIDIRHGKRLVTRYAHLSKTIVEEGQRICRGQVIGLVGSTGRSTGPHLHYEIRVGNSPVNPQALMQLASVLRSKFL